MKEELLEQLMPVTAEEEAILNGQNSINRSLYYREEKAPAKSFRADEIDAEKVLTNGKLIDMRPHTRFVHFPKHTHNYVEFVYMCRGSTT
ncbi:MAG: AraC family transcriptional regulator, partial [Lachnospiraceae bacterium]|nr:AraC family transcriptional regulator [Lachnospiraceae bacterium]